MRSGKLPVTVLTSGRQNLDEEAIGRSRGYGDVGMHGLVVSDVFLPSFHCDHVGPLSCSRVEEARDGRSGDAEEVRKGYV